MDGETVRPALKILATQLTEAQAVEGGFQLRSLPVFDRVWVQVRDPGARAGLRRPVPPSRLPAAAATDGRHPPTVCLLPLLPLAVLTTP